VEHRIPAPREGIAVARRRLAAAASGRRSGRRRRAEDATATAPESGESVTRQRWSALGAISMVAEKP
jgi:hypothetical protein